VTALGILPLAVPIAQQREILRRGEMLLWPVSAAGAGDETQ
jgi:hypothetical protein